MGIAVRLMCMTIIWSPSLDCEARPAVKQEPLAPHYSGEWDTYAERLRCANIQTGAHSYTPQSYSHMTDTSFSREG